MWPLLFLSISAFAIILERYFSLRISRLLPDEALARATQCLQHPTKNTLQALSEASPLGYILSAGLMRANQPIELIEARMEEAGRYIMHRLEKYLSSLAIIAMISPLLGLLGTVLGMITVFSNLMVTGAGDPQALAGGISAALLTTAAGLMIAIPSTVAHRYFERHLEGIAMQLEQQSQDFLALIEQQQRAQFKKIRAMDKSNEACDFV